MAPNDPQWVGLSQKCTAHLHLSIHVEVTNLAGVPGVGLGPTCSSVLFPAYGNIGASADTILYNEVQTRKDRLLRLVTQIDLLRSANSCQLLKFKIATSTSILRLRIPGTSQGLAISSAGVSEDSDNKISKGNW